MIFNPWKRARIKAEYAAAQLETIKDQEALKEYFAYPGKLPDRPRVAKYIAIQKARTPMWEKVSTGEINLFEDRDKNKIGGSTYTTFSRKAHNLGAFTPFTDKILSINVHRSRRLKSGATGKISISPPKIIMSLDVDEIKKRYNFYRDLIENPRTGFNYLVDKYEHKRVTKQWLKDSRLFYGV